MNLAQAFARQAASDLGAREALADAEPAIPKCHALHFLQTACEKLCKAAMISAGTDPLEVQRSRAHIAKHLPESFRLYMSRGAVRLPRDSWIVAAIRRPARKFELPNPAVRDGGRSPENMGYPWLAPDGVSDTAPAEYRFDFRILFEKAGVTLLKVVRLPVVELRRLTGPVPKHGKGVV